MPPRAPVAAIVRRLVRFGLRVRPIPRHQLPARDLDELPVLEDPGAILVLAESLGPTLVLVTQKRKRDPLDLLSPERGRAKVPFAWVIDEIAALDPTTRPMFGCTAVYARGKIVFILRQRGSRAGSHGSTPSRTTRAGTAEDDGVWVATTREHHESLRRQLPSMRSITVFGSGETGWQVLPAEADGFEEEVLRACALVRADDPRIGKVPKAKRSDRRGQKSAKKTLRRSPPARSSRSRRVP